MGNLRSMRGERISPYILSTQNSSNTSVTFLSFVNGLLVDGNGRPSMVRLSSYAEQSYRSRDVFWTFDCFTNTVLHPPVTRAHLRVCVGGSNGGTRAQGCRFCIEHCNCNPAPRSDATTRPLVAYPIPRLLLRALRSVLTENKARELASYRMYSLR